MSSGPNIWLITGISRGFGRELATALLVRGDSVIGTTRNGAADIPRGKGRLDVLALDVTDSQAVKTTVAAAFQLHGRIDVIVNNAGYGLLSSVEEATDEEIEHVFAVNFHGTRRVIQAALPRLRAQRGGHVVNITSMAAVAPNPGSGYYAAAKMAVEGLSQSLAKEVAPLGIRVTLVEPSAFRTEFLSERSIRRSAARLQDYAVTAGAARERLAAMAGKQPGDPARAAAAIIRAVESPEPPLHLVLGSDAYHRTRQMLDAFSADVETWKDVSIAADYDSASR
ncbi:MAG TPA: oxidoreductase [Steroidobacteraceae bacterium]|nr:oxidoreductase [Steroidobacteraceae bacterium]